MKYLKVFDNQTNNRFEKFIADKKQFLIDVDEYFNVLNPNINVEEIDSNDINYYEGTGRKEIEIFYTDQEGDNQNIILRNKESLDFINFINNTEMYRDAKKYNI